jgi:hypothetical protein
MLENAIRFRYPGVMYRVELMLGQPLLSFADLAQRRPSAVKELRQAGIISAHDVADYKFRTAEAAKKNHECLGATPSVFGVLTSLRGINGGMEIGRLFKAAIDGTEGSDRKEKLRNHLAQSLVAVAAGTDNAQHRQHVMLSKSDGGLGKKKPTAGRRGPRPNDSRTRTPFVCSYCKPNNKLSAKAICFDPNCKSARSCTAAKQFIYRRDAGERAAKRARFFG